VFISEPLFPTGGRSLKPWRFLFAPLHPYSGPDLRVSAASRIPAADPDRRSLRRSLGRPRRRTRRRWRPP